MSDPAKDRSASRDDDSSSVTKDRRRGATSSAGLRVRRAGVAVALLPAMNIAKLTAILLRRLQRPTAGPVPRRLVSRVVAAAVLAGGLIAGTGCSSSSGGSGGSAGSAGGACYGNGTCDSGLTCTDGTCIVDGGSSSGGSGGSSSGGSGDTVCSCNYDHGTTHVCYVFDSSQAAETYCSGRDSSYTLEACPSASFVGYCPEGSVGSNGLAGAAWYSDCPGGCLTPPPNCVPTLPSCSSLASSSSSSGSSSGGLPPGSSGGG